jgi:hypothetical protein
MTLKFRTTKPIIDIKYRPFEKTDAEISDFFSNTPLFGFDYICMDGSKFSFNQDNFDSIDAKYFFQCLKEMSLETINSLIDKSNYNKHFHQILNPTEKLRTLLKNTFGDKSITDDNLRYSIIAQFALYTNKINKSTDNDKNKSPRIFFIICGNAIFYILFYDPYHEIFSSKNKNKKK